MFVTPLYTTDEGVSKDSRGCCWIEALEGISEHLIPDPMVQELRCHKINLAPSQDRAKLLLHTDQSQARHMPWLEFYEHVHITLWTQIAFYG